ncbi:MAG: hypothetical protein DME45_03005 [Verrucomicrobia bacterium]|nr:MAG: hypothetical protein DME45_03005 [Verrucomicrobiota bacterium]
MAQEFFRYETPYGRPPQRVNYFAWTVVILLLTGFAFAAWLGSFYIFWQPERPDSYRLLRKLHRIDPPRRFELTAAPAGEFLNPKQLHDRYAPLGEAELSKTNSELARNYIRNFQQVHGLVPYVVGRFRIIEVHQLGSADIFTSGMVALAAAIDNGEVLLEHVYPADRRDVPLMRQTLAPGLEITLERSHDISAVIHGDRTADGRILITAMPLLYGTYTVTRGTGTFSLEPPLDLNLAAGWPLFKREELRAAEDRFAQLRQHEPAAPSTIAIPGISPSGTPPPSENQLVRVEPALPIETPAVTPPPSKTTKPTPAGKAGKIAKNQKPTAIPSATAMQVAKANTPAPTLSTSPLQTLSPTPAPILAADGTALASTAGGGNWKTYPPGKMPLGRLIATTDLNQVADRGLSGERTYLKGQFVVNFADANKAVLRPRSRMPDSVMLLAGGNSTRIIVEYPAGYVPPKPGSIVSRDEVRPFEITEVRKQEDGQLNVFAREIMQP